MRTLLLLVFAATTVVVLVASKRSHRSRHHRDQDQPKHKKHLTHQSQSKEMAEVGLRPPIPIAFMVSAEFLLRGNFILCNNGEVKACLSDKCANATCEEANYWTRSSCPGTPSDSCDDVTCACDSDKGYFRANASTYKCIHKDQPECARRIVPKCNPNEGVLVCPVGCNEWTNRDLKSMEYNLTGKCIETSLEKYGDCSKRLECQCVYPYVRDVTSKTRRCVEIVKGIKQYCERTDPMQEAVCKNGPCELDECRKNVVIKRCSSSDKELKECKKLICSCKKGHAFKKADNTKCVRRESCDSQYNCTSRTDKRCLVPKCNPNEGVLVCPVGCNEWTNRDLKSMEYNLTGKCIETSIEKYGDCSKILECQCVYPYVRDVTSKTRRCVEIVQSIKQYCERTDPLQETVCKNGPCELDECRKNVVTKRCSSSDKELKECKKLICSCKKGHAFKKADNTKCVRRESCDSQYNCTSRTDKRCLVPIYCPGNSSLVCPDGCREWTNRDLFHSIYNTTGKCIETTPKQYDKCTQPLECKCVYPHVRNELNAASGCMYKVEGIEKLCSSWGREAACLTGSCIHDFCKYAVSKNRCPTDYASLDKCKEKKLDCACKKGFAFLNDRATCVLREKCPKKG